MQFTAQSSVIVTQVINGHGSWNLGNDTYVWKPRLFIYSKLYTYHLFLRLTKHVLRALVDGKETKEQKSSDKHLIYSKDEVQLIIVLQKLIYHTL